MRMYKCEFCGFVSDDPTQVSNCEKIHLKPSGIDMEQIEYDIHEKYPRKIKLRFPDGTEQIYESIKKSRMLEHPTR
jgi:primosomal protein N'